MYKILTSVKKNMLLAILLSLFLGGFFFFFFFGTDRPLFLIYLKKKIDVDMRS